jgi:hypothetical protein
VYKGLDARRLVEASAIISELLPIYLSRNFRLGIHEPPDLDVEVSRPAGTITHLGYREYQVMLQTIHETSAGNCFVTDASKK